MIVSVIICSHNPRPEYLSRVLQALRSQTMPKEEWELLLVDNASDVALKLVWDISWHPSGRHVHEPRLGLAIARRAGMQLAASDLIVFVDDDNVIEPNYLEKAVSIGRHRPDLGVWGSGSTVPEYESQPDDYVQRLIPYLALRNAGAPKWGNILPCAEATPWGAGMCVRRNVAAAYRKYCETAAIQIVDRCGSQVLTSGGDVEICYVACDIGLGIGVFPELRVTHLIPRGRVAKDYLLKLVEGTALSEMLLAYEGVPISGGEG